MAELEPPQQYVIDEVNELKERLDKLRMFFDSAIYANLSAEEKKLLVDQEYHMSEYHKVLLRRITLFTDY